MTKRRASATQQDQNYRVDSVRRELSKINGEVLYSIYMTGTRDDRPYVTYVQEINDNWRLWSDVVLRQSTQPLTVKISSIKFRGEDRSGRPIINADCPPRYVESSPVKTKTTGNPVFDNLFEISWPQ